MTVMTQAAPKVASSAPSRHISFSAVNTFAACPLRYYFRYIAALPEPSVATSLAFGSAFHAGLELHFRELMIGNEPPSLDLLLGEFWESWNANTEGRKVQFSKGDNLTTLGRLAERMFVAFKGSEMASPSGTIIGIEEELRGLLIPGIPDLLARVDLLVDSGDALTVTDFKTSRSAWSDDHAIESGAQLLLYHELVKELADGRPIRLSFGVVSKAKTPSVELHAVPVDARKVERTKRTVERVWQAIQFGAFYPNPSFNCTTCPYREPCRRWAG